MGRVAAGEAPSLVAGIGASDQAGEPEIAEERDAAASGAPVRRVHRVRDLDRAGRRWALALAAAVLLAPLAALVLYLLDWTPTGDPALMGIRSLDVGTERTPLLGQPSTARDYAGADGHVHHPGALHFYLMAAPIRLLGGAVGMPLVSVAITGSCLLVALWAVFRQLGRAPAVVAAAALSLTAFTTGASSLVNPVSSNIAGYPLLASTVLLWCLLCGDVRLLPLATAAISFTAQQHLSVDPSVAVLTAGTAGAAVWRWRRGRGANDRAAAAADLGHWVRWSVVVALVMWAPILAQQAFGGSGNLGQMIRFARDGNSDTVGYAEATWQVVHAVGLPPLLGRTNLTGAWLTSRPSAAAWVSAAAVLGLVAVVAWRRRTTEPRLGALGGMVGLVCLAGVVSGASVPVGIEQQRLPFYHWAIVAGFLVALTLGVAALAPARALVAGRAPSVGVRRLALATVVALVAAPALVGVHLDRRSNTLSGASSTLTHDQVAAAADGVVAHRDALGDDVVLLSRGEPLFGGVIEGVAFELIERGIDVRLPLSTRFFVHDDRLARRADVDGAVVVVVDRALPTPAPAGGELVSEVDLQPGYDLDVAAYEALLAQAAAATSEPPPDLRSLPGLSDDEARLWAAILEPVARDPERLARPEVLTFLLDHPDVMPWLDRELVARVFDTLPPVHELEASGGMTRLRVYLLDRAETLRTARRSEIGTR
jgi:hypothetical protein